MLEIVKKDTKINFVGYRYVWMGISAAALIATIVLWIVKGPNYGIDFTGGAEMQLNFKKSVPTSELRAILEGAGLKNLAIKQLGDPSANQFLVNTKGEQNELQQIANTTERSLSAKMDAKDFEIARVDVVGPQAGSQLRKSGFLAMFYTLLCILLYVAIRFDFRYAPGAVLALIHDSMITMCVLIITQKEFSLQIVAAILTVIGYSNNDTIVIYDRVRETLKAHPGRSLEELVNTAINETLSRTLLTALTTLFVVLSLMFFGGSVIHDFAFALAVGIVVGTYSTIFVASSALIAIAQFKEKRSKRAGGGILKSKPA